MICEIAKYIINKLTCSYDKIIFLDFDGVLSPIDNVDNGRDKYGEHFNARCTENLNAIIETTGAHIVITSSWRQYLSLWQLQRMCKKRGIKGEIVGVTPIRSIHRGNEIDSWLSKKNCHRYVILDDMNESQFNKHQRSSLIICDGRKGLSHDNTRQAIDILSS